jgi:thiol-disulfide isomerase/thioredoxin
MKLRLLGLAVSLVCLTAWSATAQTLSVGDNSPALEVSRWVKGDKVEKLEKDQTYVVEFWATWCGPCKTSIPHLTELQKKYKDKGVKIIGVSVGEKDQKIVEPFVKKMGDKMVYSVALDDVPKGGDAGDGKMAKNWMAASESEGIPTAFIVKSGKIAWIGHPMKLDKPLEAVTGPDFDLARFVSATRTEMAKEKAQAEVMDKKIETLVRQIEKLGDKSTPKQVLEAIDKAIAESPDLEEMFGLQKYGLMIQAGDKNASAYGTKLVEGILKDDPEDLNDIAWLNLDEEGEIPEGMRDLKMALKAALRANELSKGEDGEILDTLALAYFKTGDPAKALETQEKALKATPDADADKKARLKRYQKAVDDKKKKP